MAMAAAGDVVTSLPLTASIGWNGQNPYQASGASGTCVPSGSGSTFQPNILDLAISGGTPPYSATYVLSGDPSGKIGVGPDASAQHTTLNWTGFSLNELESVNIDVNVTDSAGGHTTAHFVGSVLIKRTS